MFSELTGVRAGLDCSERARARRERERENPDVGKIRRVTEQWALVPETRGKGAERNL